MQAILSNCGRPQCETHDDIVRYGLQLRPVHSTDNERHGHGQCNEERSVLIVDKFSLSRGMPAVVSPPWPALGRMGVFWSARRATP